MPVLWIAALGGETLYQEDLRGCCGRCAWRADASFDCPACGPAWQAPLPVEPAECGFTERATDGERKGAA